MYIFVCISSVASHVAYLANDVAILYFIDYILDSIAPDLCNTNVATLLPYLMQHHLVLHVMKSIILVACCTLQS